LNSQLMFCTGFLSSCHSLCVQKLLALRAENCTHSILPIIEIKEKWLVTMPAMKFTCSNKCQPLEVLTSLSTAVSTDYILPAAFNPWRGSYEVSTNFVTLCWVHITRMPTLVKAYDFDTKNVLTRQKYFASLTILFKKNMVNMEVTL